MHYSPVTSANLNRSFEKFTGDNARRRASLDQSYQESLSETPFKPSYLARPDLKPPSAKFEKGEGYLAVNILN